MSTRPLWNREFERPIVILVLVAMVAMLVWNWNRLWTRIANFPDENFPNENSPNEERKDRVNHNNSSNHDDGRRGRRRGRGRHAIVIVIAIGVKRIGYGREGGVYGLEEFCTTPRLSQISMKWTTIWKRRRKKIRPLMRKRRSYRSIFTSLLHCNI